MNSPMRLRTGTACLLGAVMYVAAATAGAGATAEKSAALPAKSLRVQYGISLIGLPIGSASIIGTLNPRGYKIEATGKLTGLAGVIINSKGAATSTGGLIGGKVDPATFAASAATSNYRLTIRMAMAKGNTTGVEITPPYQTMPDRVPLTDADRRGIIDPLSAFIMPVPSDGDQTGPAACNRTLQLFDGGVRFDIILSYTGSRQVTGAGYSGPVAVCAARYRPIAGHRPERPATKFMAANKEIELWLAPVSGTRYVFPYRLSVLSMLGTTVIEASEVAVGAGVKADARP